MQPSKSEYDMVPDADEEMEHVLCLVLNNSGNRLGVGGSRGFRMYALRSNDGPNAAGAVETPPYLELIVRYPCSASAPNPESSDEFLPELDNNNSSSAATTGTSSSPKSVNSGVGAMALLGTTNIVAVCGGGSRPIGPQHQVLVFSAHAQQPFLNCAITLGGAVRKMIATPRFLAVLTVTELEIVSYTGERWYSWSAFGHPSSSSPLALHVDHRLIAFPIVVLGGPAQISNTAADVDRQVREATLAPGGKSSGSSDAAGCSYGAKIIQYPDELCFSAGLNIEEEFDKAACLTIAEAHHNPLAALCLNFDGTLLATSSERGTLIRLWNTRSGAKLLELRNTSTASTLGNLCFVGNLYLAGQCQNRIKIFYVGEDDKEDARTQEIQFWRNRKELAALKKNQTSIFAPLGSVLSYFNSAWAATECELPSTMTPACLPIVRDNSQPNATTAVVSALQTTSNSFWGYLSTWVNSSNPVGTSPSPLSALSAATAEGHHEEAHASLHRSGAAPATSGVSNSTRKEPYSLNTWEDLCVVWWEEPRMSTPVVTTEPDGEQVRRVRATDSFFCANCDGKVIKIQFDALRGEIRAGPPVPPLLPENRSRR